MNIFVLDNDPMKAAQYAVDRHVVKMPTETSQLLITRLAEEKHIQPPLNKSGNIFRPLSKAHLKHPCYLWLKESDANFRWLVQFGRFQCAEYTYRYGRRHFSENYIDFAARHLHLFPANDELTEHKQAMPEYLRNADVVTAYRNYYLREKHYLFNWKKRERPFWTS